MNQNNSSSASSGPSKRVFVGNIPYEFTEEQLIEIFQQVGPVVNFRLVFDKDSGKPKGFGFCDYHDVETASSAVRNLNNYDIGNRLLRVDFAGDSSDGGEKPASAPTQTMSSNQSNYRPNPPVPNHSSVETIDSVLNTMNKDQIHQVLEQLKIMQLKDPRACHQLLQENPQLNYFLLRSFLILDFIQDSYFNQLVNPGGPPNEDIGNELPPDQQKMLYDRILNMSIEEIELLPPDQKEKILNIRNQLSQSMNI